jgi:membrane-bound ClpP family serine protease
VGYDDRVTTSSDDAALARVRELTRPTVTPVESPATVRSLLGSLWSGWRLPAAGALAVVLLVGLALLAAPSASWWVLALVSVGTGLALATYLPAAGQSLGQSFGGLCGIAGLCLPLMGVSQLAQGAAGTAQGYAVALVVVGLAQRTLTAGSCGTR